ncbi:hypothetical protein D3C76_1498840 [compost metagenome]
MHDPAGDGHVSLGDQLVLAGIVVADQPHRDTGFGRNLADRGALEAMTLQAGQRGLDQIGLAQFGQHAAEAGFLGHRSSSSGDSPVERLYSKSPETRYSGDTCFSTPHKNNRGS